MKVKLLILTLMVSHTAMGGVKELEAAANKFCEKMKVCIKQEMAKEMGDDIPQQMRDLVDQMANQMCQQALPEMMPDESMADKQDFIEAGTQCLQDMQNIPCDQFETAEEPASCKRAQALAEKYGQ